MSSKTIRILSLPSYHWYMRKFNDGKLLKFVNPDDDFFMGSNIPADRTTSESSRLENLKKQHPPSTYDVVHIHFEYQHINFQELSDLLDYFKDNTKPIIWTFHDRRSNDKEFHDSKYEDLLFNKVDKIITLTNGCKNWILNNFGEHRNEIEVLRHGYIEDPKKIERLSKSIFKNKNIFTYLIGNFRPNKEVIDSIINLLSLSELKNVKLKIIYNPFSIYSSENKIDDIRAYFYEITRDNKRIQTECHPFIEHDLITEAFLESHCIILPYKWGTHSGQIELARDCGCHVVAPDVGFYKEQWENVQLWEPSPNKDLAQISYAEALSAVHKKTSLKPNSDQRKKEFQGLLKKHYLIYKDLL